jgi:ribosomal-protein-alanine N-acetyltransferase
MVRYAIDHLREADLDDVHAIDTSSFSMPWSIDTYRQELRAPQRSRYVVARFLVADTPHVPPPLHSVRTRLFGMLGQSDGAPAPLSGTIVGHAGIMRTPTDGHITTLAVLPDHRRQGVGELLLLALIEHAYDLGVRSLTLEVRTSNMAAQQLYAKYGFFIMHTVAGYYRDNHEDAVVMVIADITSLSFREQTKERSDALYQRLIHKNPRT